MDSGVPSTGSSAAGSSSMSNAGSTTMADAGGAPVVDSDSEACAEMGIEIATDCSQCPFPALSCECLQGFGAFPEETCTFGKCVAAVDCDRVCQNVDGMTFGPEFGQDVLLVQDCLATLSSCASETDCGGEHCIGETVTDLGFCSVGMDYSPCGEPADCEPGFHCVMAPYGMCERGDVGSPCNSDAHCEGGAICVIYKEEVDQGTGELAMIGACTTGAPNELCNVDQDCQDDQHCVRQFAGIPGEEGQASGPSTPTLGTCSPGNINDLCDEDAVCQSGVCVQSGLPGDEVGRCRSGEFRSYCWDGANDCLSGYCSRQDDGPTTVGTCVPGDLGSPCFRDDACAGGLCGLNPGSSEGICVAGGVGDPCRDTGDCIDLQCQSPSTEASTECMEFGDPCGTGGICTGDGYCHHGQCG